MTERVFVILRPVQESAEEPDGNAFAFCCGLILLIVGAVSFDQTGDDAWIAAIVIGALAILGSCADNDDRGGPETEIQAGGPETDVEKGGPEATVESGGPEVGVETGGPPTETAAGGPPNETAAGGPPTETAAGGPQVKSAEV